MNAKLFHGLNFYLMMAVGKSALYGLYPWWFHSIIFFFVVVVIVVELNILLEKKRITYDKRNERKQKMNHRTH